MSTTITPSSTKPPPSKLPSPADRPGAAVVIFDGHCKMCTAQVKKLPWWDCQSKLSFLSLHDPEVAQRYPDLTHDRLMQEMYIVDATGNRYRGAGAIRFLSRRLRRLWWLAPVLHIPFSLPLWQWLYRQVADRRYRFGRLDDCDSGACQLHSPAARAARSREST